MTYEELSDAVDRLCDYFNRRTKEPKTKKDYYVQTKDIPSDAVPWIIFEIQRTCNGLPWNLGKSLCDTFDMWKLNLPTETSSYQEIPCESCGREGRLHYYRLSYMEIDGIHRIVGPYIECCLCADCKNYLAHHPPNPRYARRKKAELEKEWWFRGWAHPGKKPLEEHPLGLVPGLCPEGRHGFVGQLAGGSIHSRNG